MANLEVLALDTVTPQIRAPGAGDGYSVPRDMTLASGTVLSAPTVDATNVEVTNLKAKDGTAAGSIADSTGVVTLGSSVLTTTDINGGTIDGTTIGGSSAAAGTFTTVTGTSVVNALGAVGTPSYTFTGDLNTGMWSPTADTVAWSTGGSERMRIDSSGNVGIGTASPGTRLTVSSVTNAGISVTDGTVTTIIYNSTGGVGSIGTTSNHPVDFYANNAARMRIDSSGNVGIGGTAGAFAKIQALGTLPNSSNQTYTFLTTGTIPSSNTGTAVGFYSNQSTAAASFTLSSTYHFYANPTAKGAGSTITNQYGFVAESTLTDATNNYGFFSNIASGSNRWNFYAAGTARNYFAGGVEVVSGTTGMTTGFTHIPGAAGVPTGAPTNPSGNFPMYFDSTNNRIYVYNGTAWRYATTT